MNPMSDKRYRNCRANELDREILRHARIHLAKRTRPADLANPTTTPVRFSIQQWLVTISASAKGGVRRLSMFASRPAGS
jgi:hypothetical protein